MGTAVGAVSRNLERGVCEARSKTTPSTAPAPPFICAWTISKRIALGKVRAFRSEHPCPFHFTQLDTASKSSRSPAKSRIWLEPAGRMVRQESAPEGRATTVRHAREWKRRAVLIRNLAASAAIALLTLGAGAQVQRCVEASGKVTYTDQLCGANAKRSDQVMGYQATVRGSDPYAAERIRMSIERARALKQDTVDGVVQQSQGESGAAIMERQSPERMNQAAAPDDPNPVSCDTYSTRKGCMGGSRGNNPNWSPRRGYYGGGGSADRQYEEEQAKAAALAASAKLPDAVSCNQGGCWGSKGRYDAINGGRNLVGPDGTVCHRSSTQYFCN